MIPASEITLPVKSARISPDVSRIHHVTSRRVNPHPTAAGQTTRDTMKIEITYCVS